MLNEWQEFLDYTEPVEYRASSKKDTTWLGRFTFEALRDFSGMNRILTIIARGFLFHASDGTLLSGDPFVLKFLLEIESAGKPYAYTLSLWAIESLSPSTSGSLP